MGNLFRNYGTSWLDGDEGGKRGQELAGRGSPLRRGRTLENERDEGHTNNSVNRSWFQQRGEKGKARSARGEKEVGGDGNLRQESLMDRKELKLRSIAGTGQDVTGGHTVRG